VLPVFEELSVSLRARYSYLYLLTWEEERAERGIAEVAEALERPLLSWASTTGLVAPEGPIEGTHDALGLLNAIAERPGPGVVLIKDFHAHIEHTDVIRRMRDLRAPLGAAGWGLVFVSPRSVIPTELDKDITVLDLPLPGLAEVAKLFHALLRGEKQKVELDLFERFVKASLGLTEQEIKRLYSKVLLKNGSFTQEQLKDVIAEKRQIIRKAEYLEFHALDMAMSEVGGLDNLKDWLKARADSFSEKARKYGLPQPKGLFLLGVQGCGKSMTAKAIAELWRVPLLRLDVAALVMGRGAAEEGLRRTIGIAESMAPAILWVDEIEKAFAGVDGGGGGAAAARVFGSFITWLQEKKAPVFVVATANDVRHMPPEMLRKGRFDEIFWVDLPNIHERQQIFEIHLRRRRRDPKKFDSWKLAEASDRFSGAEIEQAIVDAMFDGFGKDREFNTTDVLRALRATVPLAITMDQSIKELKEWARDRTRPATYDSRRVDFFNDWDQAAADSV
jgi:ATP-dependent 26S proteasome regulatory subunit